MTVNLFKSKWLSIFLFKGERAGDLPVHLFGKGQQLIYLRKGDYLFIYPKGNGHLVIYLGKDCHQSIHLFV